MKPTLLRFEVTPYRALPANAMLVLPTLTGIKPPEPRKPHLHAWATNMTDLGVLNSYDDLARAGLHFTQSQKGVKNLSNPFLLLHLEGFGLAELEPRLVSRISFGKHQRVSVLDGSAAIERMFIFIDRIKPGTAAQIRSVQHVRQLLAAQIEWVQATHITLDTSDHTEDPVPRGSYVVALAHRSGHCEGRIVRVLEGPQRLREQTIRFVAPGFIAPGTELPASVVLRASELRRAVPAGDEQPARYGMVTTHSPQERVCNPITPSHATTTSSRDHRELGATVDRTRTSSLAAASARPV